MADVYHLDLRSGQTEGAEYAIVPGDPDRVGRIARSLDPDARELASKREYRTFLAHMKGEAVLVTSTGIGGPSTAIAVEELAQLGVRTFLRAGTCGAIQDDLQIGDVVITTASVRIDGTSTHYAPIEYPAVADFQIVAALKEAAEEIGARYRLGITASTASFYPGQERSASSGYIPRQFRGATEEWRQLGVLNYEMESATLLTVCNALGLGAGCATGVVNHAGADVEEEGLAAGETTVIEVVADALRRLMS